MKRGFLEKVEERMRDLDTARRIYFELGGDDEEPARTLHRRTLALDAGEKPMLIVSRRVKSESDQEERAERKRQRDRENWLKRKARIAAGQAPKSGNPSHAAGRDIVFKIFLAAANKPMRSGDVIARWPGKVALMGKERQRAYQPLHELKKLGLLRHNMEDGYYALSEAGLRAAQAAAAPEE